MDRRSFIKKAGLVGGAAAASTLAAPAIAQGVKELKLVTSWPKNFPGLGTAPERFAQRVEAASGGRYKVRVFAGGELVHPLKVNDAVQEGTADMYHSADYYYQGKLKGYTFFTAVPFGFRPDEIDAWIHHGGGQALWDEVGAQFGIKHLPCGNSGSQMGGWFNKPITSLDDFKGLKMRIPGLGGDVINQLGGTSVTLAGSEILPALQAGTVDAAEWVGPWNDLAFGFYKVVKYYHWPGFHEPGSMLSLGISKSFWDGLSEDDKALFTACSLAENNYDLAEFNANNNQALDTLINKHGVELVEFSDDIYRALGEAAKDVLAAAGGADPLSGKVYESFLDFRQKAVGWSKLSDQGYMNKRSLTQF
jgi:TRAP-type mannitol/chloroaromatic compound transport system substrate-binding protein